MDNFPAHSMKPWTALRVRKLTTLEADALNGDNGTLPPFRLPYQVEKLEETGMTQREGGSEAGKASP